MWSHWSQDWIKIKMFDFSSGQSYKQFTLINNDSRVDPDLNTPHIKTLGS